MIMRRSSTHTSLALRIKAMIAALAFGILHLVVLLIGMNTVPFVIPESEQYKRQRLAEAYLADQAARPRKPESALEEQLRRYVAVCDYPSVLFVSTIRSCGFRTRGSINAFAFYLI